MAAAAERAAAGSFSVCDGNAGVMVDTDVWIDCIDAKSAWHGWFSACCMRAERALLHVNLIVCTEVLIPQPDVQRSTLRKAGAAEAATGRDAAATAQ